MPVELHPSPVITAWYTFDMDVGRGVGPLADQGYQEFGVNN